jgi:uncharacterized membrane protein (DUF4010 family)
MQDTLKLLPEFLLKNNTALSPADLFILLQKLGVAILIGLLIGLEREHSRSKDDKTFAGVRTTPLIALLGFVAGLITTFTNYWIYFIIFAGFVSLITASHVFSAKAGKLGGTSEVALILVFLLGTVVYFNYIILAAIIAVIITLFLTLKIQLHRFVGKVSEEDLYATLKLAIITVIVLPLLPNKTYGPFDVINPRLIWYMVIFVSGISFIGYILIKIFGEGKGISITGLLGGMVSSTAVSYSLSKKSKENNALSSNLAVGIVLASTIMYPRVLIVALVLNSALIASLWLPILIFTFSGFIVSLVMSKKLVSGKNEQIELTNPFVLKSAILFGVAFGVIIFVAKAAQFYLGAGGLYAASALAGITSVDAITLSLAKLSGVHLSTEVAAAAIIIATISNNIVKAAITVSIGTRELQKHVLWGLGIVSGISVIYLIVTLIV